MQVFDVTRPGARWAAVVALAVGLAGVAACGGDDDDGTAAPDGGATAGGEGATPGDDVLGPIDEASGEPVRIGLVSDGSSDAADQSIELDAADAAVQYVNERRGGLGGRPIELVTCETQLDPAKATDCANQMVEQDVTAVLVGSSGVLEDIWRPVHEAGLPTLFFAASGDTVLSDDRSTFVLTNPQGGLIQVPIDLAAADGADRVTGIVIDVPPAIEGLESARPRFEEAGLDLELVTIPPGTADMTAQLTDVVGGDPGVVLVLGNDTFCISAFQALQALGFDGTVTAVSQCVTDATRDALPAGSLEGIVVGAPVPVGVDDETTELYRAVADTYGDGIDPTRIAGVGAFVAVAGLAAGVEGLEGEVTPESIIAALRSMPETELPGAGGLQFRCDGEAMPNYPAVCTPGSLTTTLDADGQPTTYELAAPATEG
jgi:branched-chain amino acid transport system substrate-binding protein